MATALKRITLGSTDLGSVDEPGSGEDKTTLKTELFLYEVLEDERGFDRFMAYLFKEFSTENLFSFPPSLPPSARRKEKKKRNIFAG